MADAPQVDLDAVDFFTTDQLTEDPYPYYEHLRAQCPVVKEDHHDVWMVTGYREAIQVFHDQATFSSCNAVTGPFPGFPVPLEGDDVTELIETHRADLPFSDQLPTMDPPVHTAHRGLLLRLITPKRLKENEEFMWRLADQTIDAFADRGSCEVVTDYASPFTLLVVADLLGVPEEDHPDFVDRLTRRAHGNVGSTEGHEMEHTPLAYLYERFSDYISDRRANPRDDVMTGLALATFPDGTLPDVGDAMRIAANLFAAGQETTARLIGSCLRILAERPDLQSQLRANHDLISPFMEEVLRIESPIKGDFRLSRVPSTVGDVEVPAGACVMIMTGAANRDPREFEDPTEIKLDRVNSRQHIAFGHGIHVCAGAPLARAETIVTIQRFLERFSSITIGAEHGPEGARRFEYAPTYILRGLNALHLDLVPA
jgi:hypothetical protein